MKTTICSLVPDDYLEDIREIRLLGKGTYGNVFLVEKSNGTRHAIKYINENIDVKNMGISASTLTDVDILMRLRNVDYIIKIIGICYEKKSEYIRLALILEPMDRDLENFIKRTSVDIRISLIHDLFLTLTRAASLFETLCISHFDIKPENILVKGEDTKAIFKITDFGLSRTILYSIIPSNELYTLWYRPPEFLFKRNKLSFRIYAGDIWAIAVTIIQFIIGQALFPGRNAEEMKRLIYEAIYPIYDRNAQSFENFSLFNKNGTVVGRISVENILKNYISDVQISKIDPAIIEILSRMLSLNPNDRPTSITILEAFGEKINPNFLLTLIPPSYPRKIDDNAINIINNVSNTLALSKETNLVAIEIFTRYFDLLEENSDAINARSLSALIIAAKYVEDISPITQDFISVYSRIYNKRDISNINIIEMERDILHRINFNIYNINLNPIIQRVYNKNIDLTKVEANEYAQPLERWLI